MCRASALLWWRWVAACLGLSMVAWFSSDALGSAPTSSTNEPPAQIVVPAKQEPSPRRAKSLLERGIAEDAYRQKMARAAEHARKEQEKVKETIELAHEEHARINAELNPPPPPPRLVERNPGALLFGFVLVLFGVLSKLALDRHAEHAEIRALSGGYLSDGTEVAKFVMPELFAPEAVVLPPEDTWDNKPAEAADTAPQPDPVAEFFAQSPKLLEGLFELLKKANSVGEGDERQAMLAKLQVMLGEFAAKTKPWALRPAWQMSTCLQLLVARVAEKQKDVTPSVMRTIAAGIDTLRDLCVPGIRANLLIEPALKILAVDDDALCRRAVAYALQKAGLSADFAENGQKAVEFAQSAAYDMIFLDIQMPEMDGLTACARIRETPGNAKTPVVFVTVQNDFQTRVKATAIGGAELLAKPFLVFELTVKAVMCAVRKRLALLATSTAAGSRNVTVAPVKKHTPVATTIETAKLKDHFFTAAPDYISATRDLVSEISLETDDDSRSASLAKLHVRLVTLAAAAKVNKLPGAERAAAAIEALVRKLQKDRKHVSESTLNTLSKSVNLLAQVCVKGVEARLSGRPVRFLVVEDDPLARRAVVGALQLAFERPDSVQDGAAALVLAAKRRYDVVFSDIEMPKMDGFALCRELRVQRMNADTPVVFITTHSNAASRLEAEEVGGTDFISKPFLPIEITVKALTLAYEHRLNARQESAAAKPELAAA